MTIIILILGLIVGGIFIIHTLYKVYAKSRELEKKGINTVGEIIDFKIVEGENDNSYFPIVRFTTLLGEVITGKAITSYNEKQYSGSSKNVEILYLERDPHVFKVAYLNDSQNILLGIILGVVIYLGGTFSLISNNYGRIKEAFSYLKTLF